MNTATELGRQRVTRESKKFKLPKDPESEAQERRKDPCFDFKKAAFSCIDRNLKNNYSDRACKTELQDHIFCIRFWKKVEYDRKRRNIRPFIPNIEDRDTVTKEYKEKGFFGKDYFKISSDDPAKPQ